jgi:hypothetical protein
VLIDYATAENIGELWGEITLDKSVMLKMCQEFGFKVTTHPHDAGLRLAILPLTGRGRLTTSR